VTDKLNQWQSIVDAIVEEDRILRLRLASCPVALRESRASDESLSFKETLAHIAFWDDFTVSFFSRKLDRTSCNPSPPGDFEENSRKALSAAARLPFGEVLARYLEATGALIEFLRVHWDQLSDRERNDFWVPLKHRRHHRAALFESLDEALGSTTQELAAGA